MLSPLERLDVLACATGFILAVIFFLSRFAGADAPDWLPMMITSIGGFELYMFINERRHRRSGGRNG
ncbi:hypothetical protein [Novosphingobium lentum]|uniref:hypothetical protein n=1 Tax=Novosphingobium lentum TaxID=145287 RepID=UPI00082BE312|nr:hypothetical protein [Novosphingobium lentum]